MPTPFSFAGLTRAGERPRQGSGRISACRVPSWPACLPVQAGAFLAKRWLGFDVGRLGWGMVIGSSVFVLCYYAFRTLCPRKLCGIFIVPSQSGAAVLARWFKEMLSIRIFLDSDELDHLDLIFNV